jgi:hypothetical protein
MFVLSEDMILIGGKLKRLGGLDGIESNTLSNEKVVSIGGLRH